MKTSNTNLDKLRDRARNMFAEHGSMEKVIKDLSDDPIVYILQNDGKQYELLISPDKKSYQMRDVSGQVLDEKPLENHVMLLLQQLAVSQISELLLTVKLSEFEAKVAELEKLKQKAKEYDEVSVKLDDANVEREQEGNKLDLWTRVIFFSGVFAKEVENKTSEKPMLVKLLHNRVD